MDDPHERHEAREEQGSGTRKPFLLRLPPDLHAELKRWATVELRSLNGQIEFLLREALARRRRSELPENRTPDRSGEER